MTAPTAALPAKREISQPLARAIARESGLSGAVILVPVQVWLLFLVPAGLRFAPLGAVGTPAVLWGLGMLLIWGVVSLSPGSSIVRRSMRSYLWRDIGCGSPQWGSQHTCKPFGHRFPSSALVQPAILYEKQMKFP